MWDITRLARAMYGGGRKMVYNIGFAGSPSTLVPPLRTGVGSCKPVQYYVTSERVSLHDSDSVSVCMISFVLAVFHHTQKTTNPPLNMPSVKSNNSSSKEAPQQ